MNTTPCKIQPILKIILKIVYNKNTRQSSTFQGLINIIFVTKKYYHYYKNMNYKKEGFTLVELLVVIAIIGLLSTLSVIALGNARQKARDAKRVADMKQVQTALELYYSDNNTYPSAISFGAGSIATGTATYMGKAPSSPDPRGDGAGATKCPNNNYHYYRDTPSTYHIWFCLGGTTGGINAGTNCATQAGLSDGTGTACIP
jgi:prepilin-type N-terminal cleavage/methylation domain-containing protein